MEVEADATRGTNRKLVRVEIALIAGCDLQRAGDLTEYARHVEVAEEEVNFISCARSGYAIGRHLLRDLDRIAEDLFNEWEEEIEEIDTSDLRERSRNQLQATRAKYRDMETAMRRSADRMSPVLSRLNDQVLFLKHQLNARAIGSIGGEAREIEREVERLIADIRASIREADQFIEQIQKD